MMDQIASLMQRGLISPDAAQGLVQQIANVPKPGVPNPPLEGGGAGTRIGATTTKEPLFGYSKPTIKEAATRYKDTVGTGPTHSDALYDMAQKMGYPVHDNEMMIKLLDSKIMRDVEHGFTTSNGKFVTRGEAADIMGSPDSKSIVGNAPNHLENLRSAGTDQAKFRSSLNELSADKNVKNDDLKQIVKDYDAGGVVMGKTRADHLRQIEQAFVRNARFENKLK